MKTYKTKQDIQFSQVKQFYDMQAEFEGNEELLTKKIMLIFYGVPAKQFRTLKQEEIDAKLVEIMTIINGPKGEFKNVIQMDGVNYGFIPDFNDITAGELIDIDDMWSQADFARLTSILYRPIVGKVTPKGQYEIEPYKGYDLKFEKVNLEIVEGYLELFLKSSRQLNIIIPSFMETKAVVK